MRKRGITVEKAQEIRAKKGIEPTKLQEQRVAAGLSQKELSEKSGVAFRSIIAYEQRKNDIDKAKLETLCDLALSIGCSIEDIIEDNEVCEKYRIVQSKKSE